MGIISIIGIIYEINITNAQGKCKCLLIEPKNLLNVNRSLEKFVYGFHQ